MYLEEFADEKSVKFNNLAKSLLKNENT